MCVFVTLCQHKHVNEMKKVNVHHYDGWWDISQEYFYHIGQGLIVILFSKYPKINLKPGNEIFCSYPIPIRPSLPEYFFCTLERKYYLGLFVMLKLFYTYFSIVILAHITTNNTYFSVVSTQFSILKILILLKLLVLQTNQAKVSFCRKKAFKCTFGIMDWIIQYTCW